MFPSMSAKQILAAVIAGVAALAAPLAQARSDVYFSIGVQPPVYMQPPVYVQPQPVYVAPPPVYVQPRPVYVQPAPVYVQPAPVYVQPAPVYARPWYRDEWRYRDEDDKWRRRHWKHHRDRDDD